MATERWSSRLGFLLAAVGLGNLWPFSAVVGASGGAYPVPSLFAAFGWRFRRLRSPRR